MRMKTPFFISRISFRLLTFNLLLVFLPVAGFLYLGTYEQQRLKSLEHALVQQGRILSSALGGSELSAERATLLLKRLQLEHEARLRILDSSGRLLADSSRLGPRLEGSDEMSSDEQERDSVTEVSGSPLYSVASLPVRLYRRYGGSLYSTWSATASSPFCWP